MFQLPPDSHWATVSHDERCSVAAVGLGGGDGGGVVVALAVLTRALAAAVSFHAATVYQRWVRAAWRASLSPGPGPWCGVAVSATAARRRRTRASQGRLTG